MVDSRKCECEQCGAECFLRGGETQGSTNWFEPLDRNMLRLIRIHEIPFHCALCGSLQFPIKAVRDVVFLWPDRVRDKVGSIFLPEIVKDEMQSEKEVGTILSIGPGYWDPKGRFHPTNLKVGDRVLYDKNVPWQQRVIGTDGKQYVVKLMGECDVRAIVED